MAISKILHRSPAALVFEGLWLLLGVAALAQGFLGLRDPALLQSARNSYGVVIVFGVFAIATAVTHAIHGRLFTWVGGFAGAILALYGVSLILLGHEDVGGFRVTLPTGLPAIALGIWTVFRVARRQRRDLVEVA